MMAETTSETHEIAIQPGVSPWLSMTYQAQCECGWKGAWWPLKEAAREDGDEHLEAVR